eukprot:CAMPEP_0185769182 /NCGR_PEP_ID=MMETSP1174-20130828/53424_1 /TAXON_ID=35687 /ORGANISM="Dictyocha speculum, Strain CCMP1381" /LENGTH=113 /DNA_ID=CAMNT_0028454155 /DNA_START=259 /DNA_END=597 /DNA_ORIENTATION=+
MLLLLDTAELNAIDRILDATIVSAAQDPEVTLFTPHFVPRILHRPVVDAIICTPAHEQNGVGAKRIARHVGVDAGLVCCEVLVHRERGSEWAHPTHHRRLNSFHAIQAAHAHW